VKIPESDVGKIFSVQDVARRVEAGIGSLGVARFYVLVGGLDESGLITDWLRTDYVLA